MRYMCQPGIEPVPTGNRCTGKCCESFYLPMEWSEWEQIVTSGIVPDEFNYADAHMILAMVRPDQSRPSEGNRYTCVHFSGTSCLIYSTRPNMCKEYPYDIPCEHGLMCASKISRAGQVGRRYHLPMV